MVGSTKNEPFSADSKLDDEFSVEKSIHRPSAESVLTEDDPHYGLEFPTDEEIATLRRVPDTLPWASYCACHRWSLRRRRSGNFLQ